MQIVINVALSEFCLCDVGLLRATQFGFQVAQHSRQKTNVFCVELKIAVNVQKQEIYH